MEMINVATHSAFVAGPSRRGSMLNIERPCCLMGGLLRATMGRCCQSSLAERRGLASALSFAGRATESLAFEGRGGPSAPHQQEESAKRSKVNSTRGILI